MNAAEERLLPALLEDVMGDRFGRYSKYIIQDRAIPDVRDGLKPVQRRILYAMYEAGNTPDKPYRKSAKTVGDVMGNYHPHGDASIYEGMVRMAQPWKMMYPLLDGHGNWGSLDDDPAAAMRYTEARLSEIAMEMLHDIDKETVPFRPNFDNTSREPVVLPSRFPNLLVNGASGISAGFATEIPPHNLREIVDACIALIDDPDITVDGLMSIVRGPDFPTGGIVMGEEGIREAYRTGKGRIFIRARTAVETVRSGGRQIVITEIPYQVVKAKLVATLEQLRIDRKLEGVAAVRDETGRDGLRIVLELKRDADAEAILTYLFKKTELQVPYHFNMVAIVNRTPKQLGLKDLLAAYVAHRREVVVNRSRYELARAEDRAHVVDGLIAALGVLDAVIEEIRASRNRQEAHRRLVEKFGWSDRQVEAILALQLYRLTGLELAELQQERDELKEKIERLRAVLSDEKQLSDVIKRELLEIRERYGAARKSEIRGEVEELKIVRDVSIQAEDVIVTLTRDGYVKRTGMMSFVRSGADPESVGRKEGDALRFWTIANTRDTLLLFTQRGQYVCLPVHELPESRWKEMGTALVNVAPIPKEDRVVDVVAIRSFDEQGLSLWFVTKQGLIKRTPLTEYATNRTMAINALRLNEGDEPVRVLCGGDGYDLLIVTRLGMSIRFPASEVGETGRIAAGVRGIRLDEGDEVVDALLAVGDEEPEVLVVSDAGYAKRTPLAEYPVQGRGGKGVLTFELRSGRRTSSNGSMLVRAVLVADGTVRLTACLSDGSMHSFTIDEVPSEARRSAGKPVLALAPGQTVVAVVRTDQS